MMRRSRPGVCPLRDLAPANLKKDANGFDLPIALGLLLASGQVAFDRPGNYAIVAELALTGETRPTRGMLVMALQRWGVVIRRALTTGDRMGIGIER
jgi:magnesium chelatase family protein